MGAYKKLSTITTHKILAKLPEKTIHWEFSWRCSPAATTVLTILLFCSPVLAWFSIVAMNWLISSITPGANLNPNHMLILFFGTVLLSFLIEFAGKLVLEPLTAKSSAAIQAALLKISLRPWNVSNLYYCGAEAEAENRSQTESKVVSTRISNLMRDCRDYYSRGGMQAFWMTWFIRATGLGALIILLQWNVYAGAILLIAFFNSSHAYNKFLELVYQQAYDRSDVLSRNADSYRNLAFDSAAACEMRVFTLQSWITNGYWKNWSVAKKKLWKNREKLLFRTLGVISLSGIAAVACLIFMVYQLWDKQLTPGEFAALVQALIGVQAFGPLGDLADQVARQRVQLIEIKALAAEIAPRDLFCTDAQSLELERFSVGAGSSDSNGTQNSAGEIAVKVEELSYSYAGATEKTLDRISLQIRSGEHIAIVGKNGCGKSTLMRILTGTIGGYCGKIVLPAQIRIMQQTFPKYPISLAANIMPQIVAGKYYTDFQPKYDNIPLPEFDLQKTVQQAAADTGITQILDEIDLDQIIDQQIPSGRGISGGQWQQVALARTFCAPAVCTQERDRIQEPADPSGNSSETTLYIMDEPTAALDIRVEAAVFQQFLEKTRNSTTILVTHRLANIAGVDRIIVMDDGKIIADGTHKDLMRECDLYRNMYRTQEKLIIEGKSDE